MPDPITSPTGILAERYRTERVLGEGGMSVVYLAHDLRYQRPVAVKVLRAELAAAIGAERFLAEIKTTARLQHPHIPPLLDSGEADGLLFYVMPYIDGETLARRLEREGPLSIDESLDVATEVGSAIEYAHQMGVLHRDIKPHNIILSGNTPVVMDFGIALAVADAKSSRLTDSGFVIGTAQYMSPEQTRGDRDLDFRSDLYSLACVLYEMLTGEPPHIGSTPQAVVAKRLSVAPLPVRVIRPEVPQSVDDALRRALSGSRTDRFDSVASFVEALRAVPSGVDAGWRVWSTPSHPVHAATPSLGVVVLPLETISRDSENSYICSGISAEIIHRLKKVAGLKVIEPDSARTSPRPKERVGQVVTALGVTHALSGKARFAGDRYIVDVELIEGEDERSVWEARFQGTLVTEDVFDLQAEIARAIVRALPTQLHLPDSRRRPKPAAYDLYLQARDKWLSRQVPDLLQAMELFQKVCELEPEYVRAHTGLADVYLVLGGADYATHSPGDLYPPARQAAMRALEIDPDSAEAHAALGNYLMSYEWEWERAAKHLERAIELKGAYASGRQWYSNYLHYTGHGEQALSYASRALEDDPRSVFLRSNLARHHMFRREHEEAVAKFQSALDLDPGFFGARVGKALAELLADDPRKIKGGKGAEVCRKSIEEMRAELGPEVTPPLLRAVHAFTLAVLGEEEAARAELDTLQGLRTRPHRQKAGGYVPPEFLALVHVGLHEHELALDELERACAARSQTLSQLKVEPLLEPLRPHDRFRALLARVRLPVD